MIEAVVEKLQMVRRLHAEEYLYEEENLQGGESARGESARGGEDSVVEVEQRMEEHLLEMEHLDGLLDASEVTIH